MRCYSERADFRDMIPNYPQREIMCDELKAFGEVFEDCFDEYGDFTFNTMTNARDIDYLVGLVEKRLSEFLERYYMRFRIDIERVDVKISYSRDINYYGECSDRFLMKVRFSNISMTYSSCGLVRRDRISDYKVASKFNPFLLVDGYLFECVEDRIFQKFLKDILENVTSRCQNEQHDSAFHEAWVRKMSDEISKYFPSVVEVPDYSINPFDFLEEDFVTKSYQQLSPGFDDDLSSLGLN